MDSSALILLFLIHLTTSQANSSSWQTLNGESPVVIARGGFSGMFPDSSGIAYDMAKTTTSSIITLWCDLQLTKDGVGFCFQSPKLENGSDINFVYPNSGKSHIFRQVLTKGWFSVDFTFNQLSSVFLNQGIYSRPPIFDESWSFVTVEDIAKAKDSNVWLNIQNQAFYAKRNLSMRNFVLNVSKRLSINYISSPDISFLQSIEKKIVPQVTKLVFRFLDKDKIEPTTKLTYRDLTKNLSYIRKFSSGILVPKSYIWPIDSELYLLPHTSLVTEAHNEGLEIFASDFSNDVLFSYNYSYDPLAEYLSFFDNGNFSVDGVLTDYPITPYQAINCFCHLNNDVKEKAKFLIISENGASGDYPGSTDLAYQKAVSDGVDILDCNVQMSEDNIPFCLSSINLMNNTNIAETSFRNLSLVVPEIHDGSGIYSFSLTMAQIRTLKPAISNPFTTFGLLRNPRNNNVGKLLTLTEFISLARHYRSLSGIIITVENAAYLEEHKGISVVNAVLDTLKTASRQNQTSPRILIRSSDISVLRRFKEDMSDYELVYEITENFRGILESAMKDIKEIAGSVIIGKRSVYPQMSYGFITDATNVVEKLKSHNLRVYVETFSNEFVSQARDFLCDPTVEIHSFVNEKGIDGVITAFPATAARYRRKQCSREMSLVPTGSGKLIESANQNLPPAEAPYPILRDADIVDGTFLMNPPKAPEAVKGQANSLCLSLYAVILLLTMLIM